MDKERPSELAESWINGNRNGVASAIHEADDAAALAIAVYTVLSVRGHEDELGTFALALEYAYEKCRPPACDCRCDCKKCRPELYV
jgi:hypothetical protein